VFFIPSDIFLNLGTERSHPWCFIMDSKWSRYYNTAEAKCSNCYINNSI